MDNRILTRHYFISGRVQGVGFRAFVKRIADQWKMTGWTRNLPDGRVEVLVLGGGDAQQAFEESMRRGPLHAEVTKVDVKPGDAESIPQTFEIRKDGR